MVEKRGFWPTSNVHGGEKTGKEKENVKNLPKFEMCVFKKIILLCVIFFKHNLNRCCSSDKNEQITVSTKGWHILSYECKFQPKL